MFGRGAMAVSDCDMSTVWYCHFPDSEKHSHHDREDNLQVLMDPQLLAVLALELQFRSSFR